MRERATGVGAERSQYLRLRHGPAQAIAPGLGHDRVSGEVFGYEVWRRFGIDGFSLHVFFIHSDNRVVPQ